MFNIKNITGNRLQLSTWKFQCSGWLSLESCH